MTSWKETNSSWSLVKRFMTDRLMIPERVVEIISAYDILDLCCSGMSSFDIATLLNFDVDYVKGAISSYLNDKGWRLSLDINPLMWYNKCDGDWDGFLYYMWGNSTLSDKDIYRSYIMCSKLKELKKEIDKYYNE